MLRSGKPLSLCTSMNPRRLQARQCEGDRRIEPLGVSNGEHCAGALGQGHELIGFGQARGHGLLDQHVNAPLEKRPGHREMVDRRDGDRHAST
jgi:hypothetical protein